MSGSRNLNRPALAHTHPAGIVAAILAVKLRQRGYRVVRLTTVGEPAYVNSVKDADILRDRLPADHLRVEDDRDFVPFLPPFGAHVGDKLWLPEASAPRFVANTPEHRWTDSFWINFRVPELLHGQRQTASHSFVSGATGGHRTLVLVVVSTRGMKMWNTFWIIQKASIGLVAARRNRQSCRALRFFFCIGGIGIVDVAASDFCLGS